MRIDKQLISRLENLARLELSAQERDVIQKDLNNILGMVDKLNELDTTGVEPLIYINEEINIWRADEVKNQLDRSQALQNAPDHNDTYIKVPKVIDIKNK